MTDGLIPMKGLTGLRNRARPERLEPGSLVRADNVDADDSGTLEMRDGYLEALALDGCSHAFATRGGEYLFVVENGVLSAISSDLGKIRLADGLTDTTLVWTEALPYVYYAGESQSGTIYEGRIHWPLRMPLPATPVVSLIRGDLPAGQYQVSCAWVHPSSGQASSIPAATVVEVAEGQGLRIDAPRREGFETHVYLSEPNGDRLYWLAGQSPLEVSAADLTGLAIPVHDEEYAKQSLPDGVTALAWHEGRLWAATYEPGAATSVIWFSQPFWSSMFDLARDYLPLHGRVCGMASTSAGLLIATNLEIWLFTPDEGLVSLAQYGAVPGFPITQDRTGLSYVWTIRGLVAFPPWSPLTEERAYVAPGTQCSTAIVERRGRTQCVILTDGGGQPYNPY